MPVPVPQHENPIRHRNGQESNSENEREVDAVIANAIDVEIRNIRNYVEVLQYGDERPRPREIHFEANGNPEDDEIVIIPFRQADVRPPPRPPPPVVFRRDHHFRLSIYVRNAARSIQLLSEHFHRFSRDDLVHIFQSMYDASSTVDNTLIRMNLDPRPL